MKADRLAKVNELLQHALAGRVAECWDPTQGLLTVTAVEVSPDLRHAVVWLSLLEGDFGVTEAIYPELRRAAAEVKIKYTPKLEFREDRSGDHIQRIEEIFRRL